MGLTTPITEIKYGTGVPIDKQFAIDMSDVIHTLDPPRNPMLTLLNQLPKKTAYNWKYEWLEREGYYRRTFIGTWVKTQCGGSGVYVIGLSIEGRDWSALAAIPTDQESSPDSDNVKLTITTKGIGEATQSTLSGYIKRSAIEDGRSSRKLINASGVYTTNSYANTIQVTKDATSNTSIETDSNYVDLIIIDADTNLDPAHVVDGADAYCIVEFPNMIVQGYKQGTGLGQEVVKPSYWNYNYTRIWKTHVTMTGTQMACRMVGGDLMTMRRIEAGMSHASDIEAGIMFKGGGIEGSGGDWGIVTGGDNPLTKIKGLGVGHATGKEGFITSYNGNPNHPGCSKAQITEGDYDSYIDFFRRIYDDTSQGSSTKHLLCSTYWMAELTKLCTAAGSPFTLNMNVPYSGAIGLDVKRVITPFGNVDAVIHPMLNGPYYRFGLILDLKNINFRPLNGRDTMFVPDAASRELDGRLDYWLTEAGIELRHEHTMAIPYLKSA